MVKALEGTGVALGSGGGANGSSEGRGMMVSVRRRSHGGRIRAQSCFLLGNWAGRLGLTLLDWALGWAASLGPCYYGLPKTHICPYSNRKNSDTDTSLNLDVYTSYAGDGRHDRNAIISHSFYRKQPFHPKGPVPSRQVSQFAENLIRYHTE